MTYRDAPKPKPRQIPWWPHQEPAPYKPTLGDRAVVWQHRYGTRRTHRMMVVLGLMMDVERERLA